MKSRVVLLSLLITLLACRDSPPGLEDQPITLRLEDASCTELWLHIQSQSRGSRGEVLLMRDGAQVRTFTFHGMDTLLLEEGLQPGRTYAYQAAQTGLVGAIGRSNLLQARTLDTTSHEFTFETTLLGDGNGSVLRDVVIVNDTLAFAVGAIHVRDSLGRWDPDVYNLAIWNGSTWSLRRLTYQGSPPVVHSVLQVSSDNVWLDPWFHWNGQQFQELPIDSALLGTTWNKMGTSLTSEIYVIGSNGSIVSSRDQGLHWQKLSSGTPVDLVDISGSPSGGRVWICGYDESFPGTSLLSYRGTTLESIYDGTPSEYVIRKDSLSGTLTSVFATSEDRVLVATPAGVYELRSSTGVKGKRIALDDSWFPGFPHRIRGNAGNDWFVVGEYSFVAHYNGVHLRHYGELMTDGQRLLSVSQKGNLMIAVGVNYQTFQTRGLVITGRR